MCGAKEGGLSLDGVNVAKEAVIQGQVLRSGDEPVDTRLLVFVVAVVADRLACQADAEQLVGRHAG